METLLGNKSFRLKDFLKISDDWQTSTASGVNISAKKEWDITNPLTIDHFLQRYSGGTNGRIIAQYKRFLEERPEHVVTLHDHKFNTIGKCVVKEQCRDIFFYVSSTDELRVVTSSGRLFLFQGETVVSNLPILCPDLEPIEENQNEQESTPKQKRNREIINVAFWETGFVYIDRDGYVVEYQIDQSNIQAFDTNKNEEYIKNVEPQKNHRSKVLSRDLKSIGIPICFEVIPPEYTGLPNDSPYVFVAGSDKTIYILSEGNSSSVKFPGDIISMSFSPAYQLIAFIIHPNILLITPINLETLLFRLDIDEGDCLGQLSWAGNDIPVLSFDKFCLLILQSGETIKIPTTSQSLIIKQSDSCLIFTEKALYHTSLVSDTLANCFGVREYTTAETNAVKLLRAFCSYSHAQVSKMKENALKVAIKDLIEAAQQLECDITIDTNVSHSKQQVADSQTLLMTAACFGRSYLLSKQDDKNEITDEFVKATKWIRLANMFKRTLNICVSPKSLRETSTVDDCIARLCYRELFTPAFEVADELGGDKSAIVTRWCYRIVDKIGHDDKLCYKCLMHMKKSLTKNNNNNKSSSPSSSPAAPILSAFSKMRKGKDDFEENDSMNNYRSTCPLFDTAAIASGCLIRGHPKLASHIASNELNGSLVIPFFAASGLWKEALIAAANTWDSNVFVEVLKKAVISTVEVDIADAIESNYFAYSTAAKIVLCNRLHRLSENKANLINERRKSRSRSVNTTDVELAANARNKEEMVSLLCRLFNSAPRNKNTLNFYIKNKLRILNAEVVASSESSLSDSIIQQNDDDIKKTSFEHSNVHWLANQSDLMSLEIKAINLYQKLVKSIDPEKVPENCVKIFEDLKNLNLSQLTVNSLIIFAFNLNSLQKLIELSKTENCEEINPKKAVAVVANYLANNNRYSEFKKFLSKCDPPFYSCYRISAAVALHRFGAEKAIEFINGIADGKEKQTILAMLNAAVNSNPKGDVPFYQLQRDVYGTGMIATDLFRSRFI